jgi:hypothetical protein
LDGGWRTQRRTIGTPEHCSFEDDAYTRARSSPANATLAESPTGTPPYPPSSGEKFRKPGRQSPEASAPEASGIGKRANFRLNFGGLRCAVRPMYSIRCPGAESNHRHCDFQSHALPTELPGPIAGRVGAACLPHTRPPIKPRRGPHAASGDDGGSSSSSRGGPGIRYCSPSQRPRSTSAHRGEQNGRFAADGARPQIGQRGGALAMHSLNTPAVTGQRRVRS